MILLDMLSHMAGEVKPPLSDETTITAVDKHVDSGELALYTMIARFRSYRCPAPAAWQAYCSRVGNQPQAMGIL